MILREIISDNGWQLNVALCIRLVLAALCGALIGFERKKNFKAAGLRTHMLVCCGAALFMIISKYGFNDLISREGMSLLGTRGADPARVAAQIVSGIGFIGAGVIFKNGVNIRGLTTAAGLWMTAGVGMAIGSGLLIIGFFSGVAVAILQLVMHRRSVGVDSFTITTVRMKLPAPEAASAVISELENGLKAHITSSRILRNPDDTTDYSLTLKVPGDLRQEQIEKLMADYKEIVSIDIAM